MTKIKHPLQYGIRKEHLVAKKLQRHGCSTVISNASRGASDVKARGKKCWDIQVKASCADKITPLAPSERHRLKIQARKDGAIPVQAQVKGNQVKFYSLRTNKRLYLR